MPKKSPHPDFEWTAPGILTRTVFREPNSKAVQAHYRDDAVTILNRDMGHYQALESALEKHCPQIFGRYHTVVAIGGGHPKLERFFSKRSIVVVDPLWENYASLHKEFVKRYPTTCSVSYQAPPAPEKAPLTTFVHILEHLTPVQIGEALVNVPKDIVIYGPNVDHAKHQHWWHFRPEDHNTFYTFDGMRELLESHGFVIQCGLAYSDDYFFWAQR